MSDDEDREDLADVVDLRPPLQLVPPVQSTNKHVAPFCAHNIELDEHKRICTCLNCGKVLDPFDALSYLADTWRTWEAKHRQTVTAVRQHAKITKDVERLKVRVRNLRKKVLAEELEHPVYAYREFFLNFIRPRLEEAKAKNDTTNRQVLQTLEFTLHAADRKFSAEHFGVLHDDDRHGDYDEADWRSRLKPEKRKKR